MDDFKFNAQKMLAAQRAKGRRAQSPETESNWDSSEPEENTVTQISSDEEFSVKSSRSHKSTKSSRGASKADSKTRSPLKPDPVTSQRKASKPAADGLTSSTGSGRPAVNVFIDRGGIDSDNQSQKSTTKKTKKKKKEEKPPYDFREALRDEDEDPPSQSAAQRPGRSRKGESYDPASPKTKAKPKDEQFADTGSWDESDENQKALTRILRERDGLETNNNTNNTEQTTDPKAEPQPEDTSPRKKKGWSISLKSKTKEKKTKKEKTEEPPREMQVAMTTPPVPSLKHSEVDVVYRKEEEDVETIISLDDDERGTRYVYIYHHGNTSYADTRPSQEAVYMTTIADKSELIFRRCAREIFATLRILVDFFLIFLLEGLRFLAYNIVSAFLVGVTTGFGDYFLRPVATAIFNGLCQPFAMFCFNVGVATRTSTRPFVDVLHNFLSLVAMVIRAFRLVEVNHNRPQRTAVEDV
ncbi:chromodomain-helicase-DNA-binding protein 1-like [Strongylocentrotus purpuratus]|uniref:Uncharacterized protein n=1 Tax=Strongylocentrotus purpuratus TaxID=7668 RepID=A0A7M7P7F7_STRPU|nr:chromodomain-helicase-DNA-binding protein 1-like [Strongylocentrotus purpuratus]